MLLDRIEPANEEADVLIVGAGAVGLTMGIALARAGRRVLICEAGRAALDPAWQSHNTVVQTGRHHAGSIEGRYRGLGGTTRLWGGQLMPFTPADLAPNPAIGKPSWPIAHADLMQAVDAVLQLTGVAQSWAETEVQWCAVTGRGLDLGPDLRLAPSLWLPQPDFAKLFSRDIRSSQNLRILVGHEAIGVIVRPDGAVGGLRLRRSDGGEVAVTGGSTVIANGTLEAARLLLRIGVALPASPLAANLHVGRWFFDHLHGVAGEVTPIDRTGFGRLFDSFYFDGRKLMPKVRLEDDAAGQTGLPSCAAVFMGTTSAGLLLQDLKTLLARILKGGHGGRTNALLESFRTTGILAPLAIRYLRKSRSSNFLGKTVLMGMEMELRPSLQSFLALESGVPADRARIRVNWSVDGADIEGFAGFARLVESHFATARLCTIELDQRLATADPAFLNSCRDSNHQMGGARMALRAEDGVVDPDCQVFGMPGLFVAGAPVFPAGSFANPTLVSMALGQRLAGHLLAGRA